MDVLPTLLDLTGIKAPDDAEFDGVSLRPLLEDQAQNWPDRILVTDNQRGINLRKRHATAIMTSRWRLVGSKLTDIKADPDQSTDLAGAHSDVVARLNAFYEEWWTDLGPDRDKYERIVLGNEAANPVLLSSHDWFNERIPVWQQAQVRSGTVMSGGWKVNFEKAGMYRLSLRRWPPGIAVPLTAGLPAEPNVPGDDDAFRTTRGRALNINRATISVAGMDAQAAPQNGAEAVVFDLQIPAGETDLMAEFLTTGGDKAGPYYVVVEAL